MIVDNKIPLQWSLSKAICVKPSEYQIRTNIKYYGTFAKQSEEIRLGSSSQEQFKAVDNNFILNMNELDLDV